MSEQEVATASMLTKPREVLIGMWDFGQIPVSKNHGGLKGSSQHWDEVPSPGIPKAKNVRRAQMQRKGVLFR